MSKIIQPFVRSAYNYDRDAASDESGLMCMDPTLAQQSARDEADINVIVDRFMKTGLMPEVSTMPQFGDFTGISNYHESLNNVIAAQEAFDSLPAKIRSRFDNDPAQFMDFFGDEKNIDEAVELGIAKRLPEEPPRNAMSAEGGPKGKKPKASVSSSNEDLGGNEGDD